MRGRALEPAECTGAGRRGLGMLLTGRSEGGNDLGRAACFSTGLDMEAGGAALGRSDGLACGAGTGA
jgi:hypothetical protein